MSSITRPVQPRTAPMPRRAPSAARLLFLLTAALRLSVSVAFVMSGETMQVISRDSYEYHFEAQAIANDYATGEVEWLRWIDEGWPQLAGLLYFLIAEHLLVIMAVNALLAGAAAVLLYRIAQVASGQESVARATAAAFALFPSAIFFHALPLKECAAVLAILSLIWGTMLFAVYRQPRGFGWILLGLLIMTALRVYLVPVCLACIVFCLLPFSPRRTVASLIPIGLLGVALLAGFYFVVDLYEIDLRQYPALKYLDLELLNETRQNLSRGSGKMFRDRSEAAFGQGILHDVKLAATGLFFFLMGVDIFDIRSVRQALAIPEMLILLYCLPFLFVGTLTLWRRNPRTALCVLSITAAIIAVYGAGTTNMGAMYRWRLQALPILLMLVFYGAFERRRGPLYSLVRWCAPKAPPAAPSAARHARTAPARAGSRM